MLPDELVPHPWNTGFEWEDRTGPFETLSEDQVRQFDRDGFVVVDDIVDPALLADVVAATDESERRVDEFLATQENGRLMIAERGAITFSTHLVVHSPLLRDLTHHPTLVGICKDLVGPDVNLYWDQAVYKKPERPRRFPWHQDNGYGFVEPQQYLTCWIALTDATIDNGCPQVVPGAHRRGTLWHTYVEPLGWECFSDPDEVVAAPVRAGGAVVFSSLTPHLTGPNLSGDVRKAYIVQYAPAGAEKLEGDPYSGPPIGRQRCDAPERQYPVLRDGRPVTVAS